MHCYEYPRAALTVDAIVIAGKVGNRHVLLVQRGKEPYKDCWALPGGFIDMNETLEEACLRELYEETGLKLPSILQFRTFDAIDRDPRHRTISVVHYAFIDKIEKVKGSDDAIDAQWFPINNLPRLAFDHGSIIRSFQEVVKEE